MTTTTEALAPPIRTATVEQPYYRPELIGVRFNNEDAPYEVLRAVGVAERDLDQWQIHGGQPDLGFVAGPHDVLIGTASIDKRAKNRMDRELFERVAGECILRDITRAVVRSEDTESAQIRDITSGFLLGGIVGFAATGLPLAAAGPLVGGMTGRLAHGLKIRREAEARMGQFAKDHAPLYKELRSTVLPIYNSPCPNPQH